MSKEKISDFQLANMLSHVSGLESRERALVESALQIHGRSKGGFEESSVNDMLSHLDSAGLISSSMRKSIIKHLFTD